MKATPQLRHTKAVFGGTGENKDKAKACCLSGISCEDRFSDRNIPVQNPENPAERTSVLASGDRERILKYYTELYYNRVEMGMNTAYVNAGDAREE